MATYGGSDIFGTAVLVRAVQSPYMRQEQSYPGVTGVQSIQLGGRGGFLEATGIHYAASVSALNAIESSIYAMKDGVPRTLVDTQGRSWPYVILDEFTPSPKKIIYDLRWGYLYPDRYRIVFRRLV